MIQLLSLFLIATGQAQPAAVDVYQKMTGAVGKHRSVVGTAELEANGKAMPFNFKLMYPGYYLMDQGGAQLRGTGSKHYLVVSREKVYEDEGEHYELPTTLLIGLGPLLKEKETDYQPEGSAEDTTFEGSKAITFKMRSKTDPSDYRDVFVDPKTYLPLGAAHVSQGKQSDHVIYVVVVYRKLDFSPGLKPSDFAWSPPADYKQMHGG